MPLRIAHIYANQNNLGDWGSAEGVKLMIRQRFPQVTFKDFLISFRDLSTQEIDEINSSHDLVVIGGGGLLYPRSKGLLLRLSAQSLQRIKKPIVLFAVGLNFEPKDAHLVEPYLTRFAEVASQIDLISVRDLMTQDALKRKNIYSHLVPCPSMFLGKSPTPFLLQENGKQKIGIVPIPLERLESRHQQTYLNTLSSFIETSKDDYNFSLIGHNINISGVYETLFELTHISIINPVNPWQLMRAYDQMDFLVGSRGHMGIFALGVGKPFLFLSYNVKCDAFAHDMDYPNKLILKPEKFDLSFICENFLYLQNNQTEIKKMLVDVRKESWMTVEKFVEQIEKNNT